MQSPVKKAFSTGVNIEYIFIRPNNIDDDFWYEKIKNLKATGKQPHFCAFDSLVGAQTPAGRIARAAAIERIFTVGQGLEMRTLFAAVALFDQFYRKVNLLVHDQREVLLSAMACLAIIIADEPKIPQKVTVHLRRWLRT